MGICFTNTKPFDIISLQDDALIQAKIDPVQVRLYEKTRDLKDLPMDKLNALSTPPVIFTVKPLTIMFENVVFPFTDMHSARAVFIEHVIDIKNVDLEHKRKDKQTGKLSEESCEAYHMRIVQEITQVVIEAQSRVPGGDIPFSAILSDTYSQKKTDLKQKTRLAELVESAKKEDAALNE